MEYHGSSQVGHLYLRIGTRGGKEVFREREGYLGKVQSSALTPHRGALLIGWRSSWTSRGRVFIPSPHRKWSKGKSQLATLRTATASDQAQQGRMRRNGRSNNTHIQIPIIPFINRFTVMVVYSFFPLCYQGLHNSWSSFQSYILFTFSLRGQ